MPPNSAARDDDQQHEHQERVRASAVGVGSDRRWREWAAGRRWTPQRGRAARGGVGCRSGVLAVVGDGAADDRRPALRSRPCLDDVGDDAGDVVRAAAAQRQIDEGVDPCVRVGGGQRFAQGLLAHDAGQAVAAQQVAVAVARLADGQVGLGVSGPPLSTRRITDRCGCVGTSAGVELALVDQPLHEACGRG